jgi:hypothetical protein
MNEPAERVGVVDRIEGDVAIVVEDESGTVHRVARRELPRATREGDVLRAPVGPGGVPDWSAARVDEQAREQRLSEARAALERLRRRDPGGDVKL